MKLPGRLLLVSLVTLLLPWAGCRYVQDVEQALRQGREDTLLATARLVAAATEARGDAAWTELERWAPWRPRADDIYVHRLARAPALDGYVADWGLPEDAARPLRGVPDGAIATLVAGSADGALFLHLDIAPAGPVGQVAVVSERADGSLGEFLFLPEAPGPIRARPPGDADPRARGNWQASVDGYHMELRLPAGKPDGRLGVRLLWPGWPPAGTYDDIPGWRVTPRPGLARWLDELRPEETTLSLLDRAGFVLASAGASAAGRDRDAGPPLYRAMLPRAEASPLPQTPPGVHGGRHVEAAVGGDAAVQRYHLADGTLLLAAAAPVVRDGLILGAVEARQPVEAILSAQDAAVGRLLGTSLLASLAAAAVLLGFALRLSLRIRRLSRAAGRSMNAAGELRTTLPGRRDSDELGDLSRSLSRLLERVAEYNDYLKNIGSRLTHELRTPVAVVRSSLENLEARAAGEDPGVYLSRARNGITRLEETVNAIGAATRLEQAIATATPERFDLGELARDLAAAYDDLHSDVTIGSRVEAAPCRIEGSPELVAQMLDKLVDNAVDFTPPGGRITLDVRRRGDRVELAVTNTGSRLPAELQGRLFESMVSDRAPGEGVHLGLGLYLARLVATHHGGDITARNLPGNTGVEICVDLPAAGIAGGVSSQAQSSGGER
ncbi:MAG: ATP-binding protein [Gammaproteobacteria bacterium]